MTQICTNIEQSKGLLELGLSPETADMMYSRGEVTYGYELRLTPWRIFNVDDNGGYCVNIEASIPCWSLGALLELIPNYGLHHIAGKCSCVFYSAPRITPHPQYISDKHDNIFEAVYDMVVWLLENNYIKTEKV